MDIQIKMMENQTLENAFAWRIFSKDIMSNQLEEVNVHMNKIVT